MVEVFHAPLHHVGAGIYDENVMGFLRGKSLFEMWQQVFTLKTSIVAIDRGIECRANDVCGEFFFSP